MNPLITFALWLASAVAIYWIGYAFGKAKGRIDEAREWRDSQ